MNLRRHEFWTTLIPLLEQRAASWKDSELNSLLTPEELRECGIAGMVERWEWLLPLAREMYDRPELAPFVPFVSMTTIRILHPDRMGSDSWESDMLHCDAVGLDQFEIQAVWPKTERRYGFEMEGTLVFEGDAKSAADFIARLVANIEVNSAGEAPPASG
jgi:hypothetical protein